MSRYNRNTTKTTEQPYIHPESPREQQTSNHIPYVRTSGSNRGKMIVDTEDPEVFSGSVMNRRGIGGHMSIQRYSVAFLKAMERNYSETTRTVMARRYRRMDREFEMLYKEGIISTLSPKNMCTEDICNYLTYRSNLGNSNSDMEHDISAVINLFDYIDSNAARQCMAQYPYLRPKKGSERLDSMPQSVVEQIFTEASRIDPGDWGRMIRYGVVVIALATGMRQKELRLCDIGHVHTEGSSWTIDILHPKGEGSWGKPRTAPIDPRAYEPLRRYFLARMKVVSHREMSTRALVPGGDCEGYFASNTLRDYVKDVSKEIGYDFNLRDCRRTYGQHLIDLGADIETVSKLLGHGSTITTEGYYCSLKQTKAIERAKEVYAFQPVNGAAVDFSQLPKGFEITMISNDTETRN